MKSEKFTTVLEMRKVVLSLFLIFSFSHFFISPARAQVGEYRTDFAIGGNAGYMLSNVGFMPEVPQNMLGGLTGGLTLRYTSEKYFKSICALVAEVNLAQTGWKEDIKDADRQPVYYPEDTNKLNPLFYERKMTYLQIPLMARMGWGRERKGFQFFFQVGPQFGVFWIVHRLTVGILDIFFPSRLSQIHLSHKGTDTLEILLTSVA